MDTRNIIASAYASVNSQAEHAFNPADNTQLTGDFHPAGTQQVLAAVKAAEKAAPIYRRACNQQKSEFLRAIAEEIQQLDMVLIERAAQETGLPIARLQGERNRTTGQLLMFANLVEEGSWVDAVLDPALPDRQPLPRPDLRRMLVSLGPVVIFGASNFPLAFSVAGGDTASALAAGCPVLVKAHPAHPGTSALVGSAIMKAVQKTGMPAGVFSMLYGADYSIGEALVKHPAVKAVAFTGSFRGGMALSRHAAGREQPIPVFAEMSSINPVLLLPEALEERAEQIAEEYAASITMGAGQFCTNPGLLVGLKSAGLDRFKAKLLALIEAAAPATMLTTGIHEHFNAGVSKALSQNEVTLLAKAKQQNNGQQNQALPAVAEVSGADFLSNPHYLEEVFGPWSLLVAVADTHEMREVLEAASGQLTVSVMTGAGGASQYPELMDKATEIAGRVLMNAVPTGVEVCPAMHHGGPFPSTTDSRFTSVGTGAIKRFARPVCWQNWQQDLLPDELKDGNPLKIWRLENQKWTQ